MYMAGRVTSDSAFEFDFAKSIWTGGSYFDWSLSPAPSFFPDLFLALLLFPLDLSILKFNFIISLIQLLLLFLAFLRLFTKLKLNFPAEIVLLTVALMSISNTYGLWFLFQSSNDHLGSLIVGIYAVSFVVQNEFNGSDWLKLSLACFLGVISTSLSLISFVLPLLVFQAFKMISENHKDKYAKEKFLSMICGLVLGLFAIASLNPNPRINTRIRIGKDFAMQGIDQFFSALNYVFSTTRLPLFLFSLFVCFLIFMALLVSINDIINAKSLKKPLSFDLSLIYILTLFINTPLAIVSGSFNDMWGFRYLYMPIFLSVLVLLISMSNFVNHFSGILIRRANYLIIFTVIAFSISQFDSLAANVRNSELSRIANCIQDLKDQGEIRGAGISDYWHSRAISLLTKEDIQIEAMTNDLQPYYWMFTFDKLRLPFYDFVIVTKESASEPFEFKSSRMSELPNSYYIVDCPNTSKDIFVYKDDSLDKFIQSRNALFLDNLN